jgi:tetratricopeptide (TPR) repeat protein
MKKRNDKKVLNKDSSKAPALLLAAALLCGLGIIAYWNSFAVPFVFDDWATITMNSGVQLGTTLYRWVWLPRGLLEATFAANHAINGENVWGYHLVNLLLHILNGFLVYLLARELFTVGAVYDRAYFPDSGKTARSQTAPTVDIAALLAAAFFLVHPVQTESVTYISSRSELLSTFFYALAVLLFARRSRDRIGFRFSLIIGVVFILGMRSKETVISLPAVLFLYDFIFFSAGEFRRVLSRWRFYATFVIGGIATAIYVLIDLSHSIGGSAPGNLSSHDYFLTELRVIVRYIRMTFLPIGLNLAHDVHPSTSPFEPAVIISGLFLLAIIVLGWLLRQRNPIASFSIFWFFITLAPTSSIVSVLDVMVDHRLYLPLIGVSLSFPLVLVWIEQLTRPRMGSVLSAAQYGAAVILILIAATIMRNEVWADETTLWSDAIAKSPGQARGYSGLAQAYFLRGEYEKAIEVSMQGIHNVSGSEKRFYGNIAQFDLAFGHYDDALNAFSKVLESHPTLLEQAQTYYNIGVAYLNKQELLPAEQAFAKSLEIDPNYLPAWDSYIVLSVDAGNQQALKDQIDGMLKDGANAKAYYGLARIALQENKFKDAADLFKLAAPAYHGDKMFVFNYAMALGNAGDTGASIDRYLDALQIDPQFMQAHFNLAQIYFDKGQFQAAIPHFEEVLRVDPRNEPAHLQLARIFIQEGQRMQARNHLSAVLNVSPGNAEANALWQQTL